jgi:hypothetical protein
MRDSLGAAHSRYHRTLFDVATGGRPVAVRPRVRRLFCDTADCPVRTFTEQVDGLTSLRGWPLSSGPCPEATVPARRAGCQILLTVADCVVALAIRTEDAWSGRDPENHRTCLGHDGTGRVAGLGHAVRRGGRVRTNVLLGSAVAR